MLTPKPSSSPTATSFRQQQGVARNAVHRRERRVQIDRRHQQRRSPRRETPARAAASSACRRSARSRSSRSMRASTSVKIMNRLIEKDFKWSHGKSPQAACAARRHSVLGMFAISCVEYSIIRVSIQGSDNPTATTIASSLGTKATVCSWICVRPAASRPPGRRPCRPPAPARQSAWRSQRLAAQVDGILRSHALTKVRRLSLTN